MLRHKDLNLSPTFPWALLLIALDSDLMRFGPAVLELPGLNKNWDVTCNGHSHVSYLKEMASNQNRPPPTNGKSCDAIQFVYN